MNLYFESLGCRLNQAEMDAMSRAAKARGLGIVATPEAADWAVVNTCVVTHVAARKSRQAIRRLCRMNPTLRVAVTGCYGTMSPEEARQAAGADLVIPNSDKEQLLDRLLAEVDHQERLSGPLHAAEPGDRRTRSFIKVQDGCDNRCTYCIVTLARGPSQSRSPAGIIAEVAQRHAEGAKEIVLSGVNIGAYGRDLGRSLEASAPDGWSLDKLVRQILEQVPIQRLRLSSVEPWDVTPQLLALWPAPRLCRQLHLPLQSGSDAVLQRMGRPMSVRAYRDLVAKIRRRIPGICLSTDLIVGFPNETEDDFQATVRLARELAFARLHVFRFSARPGTAAAKMQNQVPFPVAKSRSESLLDLGSELALAYHQRFLGTAQDVLFETDLAQNGQAGWVGLTDNYLRVWVPAKKSLHNEIRSVHLVKADAQLIEGRLAPEAEGH